MTYLYDHYNREERALCSHLFRLLHEPARFPEPDPPIAQFARLLASSEIWEDRPSLSQVTDWQQARVYSEVALLRDAYAARSNSAEQDELMDRIVCEVSRLKDVNDCISWSELMSQLAGSRIHPSKLMNELEKRALSVLIQGGREVYSAIQNMFNSKPDMAITFDGHIVLIEAKLTQRFDTAQMKRAEEIRQVWASALYKDLGLDGPPKACAVAKLGASRRVADITWGDVAGIAARHYSEGDRSRQAFEYAVELYGK